MRSVGFRNVDSRYFCRESIVTPQCPISICSALNGDWKAQFNGVLTSDAALLPRDLNLDLHQPPTHGDLIGAEPFDASPPTTDDAS